MTDWRIDPERASFDVTTRPGIAGIGAAGVRVQGSFRATLDDDGAVDLSQPVAGAFSLTVGDLRTGNQWVTARIPWLGPADTSLVRGSITQAHAARDGQLELPLTIDIGDDRVKLVGRGRIVAGGDSIEAIGATLCDPRSFGIPLPPLINLMVSVRWRLFLDPFPAGVDPSLDRLLAAAGA